MIEFKNISYSVLDENGKEKSILKNINLSFPKNKVTCITGHNGSGKSTMIKLIMGILKPTSGEILYNGRNINNLNIDERAKLGLTIALQQPVKFKGLTVRNLLEIASKDKTTVSGACEYLAKVGLCAKDYLDRELDDSLSGGEVKRIEIALALAKGGEVLLFDEPETGIDLWSFDELVELFKAFKDKTVIVVSHQKKLLESADFILLLNNQEDAVIGKKKDILPKLEDKKCKRLGGGI